MSRTRLVLAVLMVLLAGYSSKAQTTPGFLNTPNYNNPNNYDVGMNDKQECRHPAPGKGPACSQWLHFKFQAFTDGTVNAPVRITTDTLTGFCGRAKIVVRDRAGNPPGNILMTVISPRWCIKGKGADTNYHERSAQFERSFKTDPAVGKNGHDLWVVPDDYEDIGLDWGAVLSTIAGAVGTAIKVKEMIFP